ncbi:glycosyl hydrolase family 28-related protein [Asticcacaulis sp. 201]|uniref:glycosyl hydrolase family 28-related protein n=1 Tax=Asticcacaulis sp. 201 TaxID=3028787 RepID=UPI002915D48F|nr:glycosyl hydrolase family 28-related protein [Asticcacaulis sp. 201]MDV6330688.1 glycosyl hydrolase family 28-related protein [Asticcacaulis sp. 201]
MCLVQFIIRILLGVALAILPTAPAFAADRDLNVKTDCQAKGDGVADDTAKIQACIDRAAHSQQAVYIPTGQYRITVALRIANHDTTVYGTSSTNTTLIQSDAVQPVFHIANGGTPIDRVTLSNLELYYSAKSPTGFAVLCENCWRTYFRQMNFGRAGGGANLGTALWVTGGNQVFVQDSVVTAATVQGMYFAEVGDVFLSNVEVNQVDTSTRSVGVVFDTGVGGIYATNVNVTGGHTGFLFENTLKKVPPNFGFFTNCLADTLNGVGWNFDSALSMRLTNSWSATAAVHGIIARDVDGLSITDSRIYNNGEIGVLLQAGARNVSIKDSTIAGNSRRAKQRYPGISVEAGVSDFQILGNMIGGADGFGNYQSYGVQIADGPSDNYMIVGNDMHRNLDGGLRDGAAATKKVVANNM